VVNAKPRPLYPRKRTGTHFIESWVGSRAGLDGCGKSRPPPQPGFDPRTVHPVASRYTDCAIQTLNVGPDSLVGIATRCGLDRPGVEYRSGSDLPHPSRPSLGPTQPPAQWMPGMKLTTHPYLAPKLKKG